jgi:predicted O-linked N-acetylglucosamine transferase (SPINDLY family)
MSGHNLTTASDGKANSLFAEALTSLQSQRFSEAEKHFKKLLRLQPDHVGGLNLLGILLAQQGRYSEAETSLRHAIHVEPRSDVTFFNLGNVLKNLGRPREALECFDKALALNPRVPDSWNNRGMTLNDLDRFEDAIADFDRAIALNANYAEAYCNKGKALAGLKQFEGALECYARTLALKPDFAEALAGQATVFLELRRYAEAITGYNAALAIRPTLVEALLGLGNAFTELSRPADSLQAYAKALSVMPSLPYVPGACLHAKLQMCNWHDFEKDCAQIISSVKEGHRAAKPFTLLALPSSPADQLECATKFIEHTAPASIAPLWTGERYSHDRIRVGYFSADFRYHAVAFLIAGVFESHDRTKFEITGFSFGPEQKGDMRERMQSSFDRFIDVQFWSDEKIAQAARELEIDIAVDLNGLAEHGRPGVFARRPSPLQINFLGYPGTSGASYMDYLIADRIIVPASQFEAYAENIIQLPYSYQANDSKRAISDRKFSRAEVGLPETGFVFCSFNNNYKLTPEIFNIWMRLLASVENSVLWLLASNDTVAGNLRAEAERRGVSGDRLVFAPRMLLHEHLARHRLADLFLDTLPYNAHTTASDALWAGLPVLTCPGTTFAARVAASLLNAIGLPELVTSSLNEYEALALKLARDPNLLASLKAKLAANRNTTPLFNTQLFTHHLETAYTRMWELWQRGEPPQSFAVDPVETL